MLNTVLKLHGEGESETLMWEIHCVYLNQIKTSINITKLRQTWKVLEIKPEAHRTTAIIQI